MTNKERAREISEYYGNTELTYEDLQDILSCLESVMSDEYDMDLYTRLSVLKGKIEDMVSY